VPPQAASTLVRRVEHRAMKPGHGKARQQRHIGRAVGEHHRDQLDAVGAERLQRRQRHRPVAIEYPDLDDIDASRRHGAHRRQDGVGRERQVADRGADHWPVRKRRDQAGDRQRHRAERALGRFLQVDHVDPGGNRDPRFVQRADRGEQAGHDAFSA